MVASILFPALIPVGASGYTIENAILFDGTNDYLFRTPTVVGNTRTFTMSVWVKLGDVAKQQIVSGSGDWNGTFGNATYFQATGKLYTEGYHGGGNFDQKLQGADLFRDPGSWYNIIVVYDSAHASPGSTHCKLIVNGVQLDNWDAEAYPASYEESVWNTLIEHSFGYVTTNGGSRYFTGYMADLHHVDGAALAATAFGEFDDNGVWTPIEYDTTAASTIKYSPVTEAGGNIGWTNETIWDRGWSLENNATVTHIGWNSGVAESSAGLYISERSSATAYITRRHVACNHSGSGWEWFALSSPYTVPSSGTFHVGVYSGSGSHTTTRGSTTEGRLDAPRGAATTDTTTPGTAAVTEASNGSFSVGVKYDTGTGHGTNGFHLKFEENKLGLDATSSSNSAATTASNGTSTWNGSTGSFTFSGDDILGSVSNAGIRSDGIYTGDFTYIATFTDNNGSDNNRIMGFYDFSEDGTFASGSGHCGMSSMTNSWWIDTEPSSNSISINYGSTEGITKSGTGTTYSGKVLKFTRTGNVITVHLDTTLVHTYSQNCTAGAVKFAHGANNSGDTAADVSWTATSANNSFKVASTPTQVTDAPTDSAADGIGNYCTLNSVNMRSTTTQSEGNLKSSTSSSNNDVHSTGTIYVTSGKWYFEVTLNEAPAGGQVVGMCTGEIDETSTGYGGNGSFYAILLSNGNTYQVTDGGSRTNASYGTAYANGGVVNVAIDVDNQKIWFGEDGTWNASGDPAAGSNAAYTTVSLNKPLTPFTGDMGGPNDVTFNFGQTAFAGTVPTGFKALNTANLPAPTISDPSKHFGIITHTGNTASYPYDVTNSSVDFTPDFGWSTARTTTEGLQIIDVVGGVDNYLYSDETYAYNTGSNITFIENGYRVASGGNDRWNKSSVGMVTWLWKAGGAPSTVSGGMIKTSDSSTTDITRTVNTTAGFSIIGYTGNGAYSTIAHGLGATPKLIIVKQRNGVSAWKVFHADLSSDQHYLVLNETDAEYTFSDNRMWGPDPVAGGTTHIGVGDHQFINDNTDTYVAYVWAEVDGFSKFGTYEGNNDANGPFIYLGFKPSLLIIKNIDASANWVMNDGTRGPYNPSIKHLAANSNGAEYDEATALDILSNGFKLRTGSSGSINGNNTYIYAAWAESPFGGDGVAQAKAR